MQTQSASRRTEVQMPMHLRARLERRAQQDDRPMSRIIYAALTQYLNRLDAEEGKAIDIPKAS